MRITGGTARGRALRGRLPEGVRPTSARVREALFSMLGQDLDGLSFLDAFGGSGLVGLEAWSRGAQVTVYERRPAVARWIRDQGRQVGATWSVQVGDVTRVDQTFDLVFADPPYADEPLPIAERLASCVGSELVFETPRGARLPDTLGELTLRRERRYGGTRLWRYAR